MHALFPNYDCSVVAKRFNLPRIVPSITVSPDLIISPPTTDASSLQFSLTLRAKRFSSAATNDSCCAATRGVAEITSTSISLSYSALKADYDKEIDIDVISATPLAAAQQESLVAALEKRFARKVKLNCSEDATVVGGLIIKAGDTVIDGSLRGKLNRLATTLQS